MYRFLNSFSGIEEAAMKRSSSSSALFCALLLTFLLSSCLISAARLLAPKPGEGAVQIEKEINSLEMIGIEKCEDQDEECLKRRMMAEAHLDYIYTHNFEKP